MTDAEKQSLSPEMQEAVTFVELWTLAGSIIEFLRAIGWPDDKASRTKANARANFFRKNGVHNLKELDMTYENLDYSYLNLRAAAALAQLAGRKEEALILVRDVQELRRQACRLVAEISQIHAVQTQEQGGVR